MSPTRWSDDDLDDDEFPDEDWDEDDIGEQDDEAEVLPCPHCGADVYEDAPKCPACGHYITFESSLWSSRPWWWILLGLLGIAAVIWAFSGL